MIDDTPKNEFRFLISTKAAGVVIGKGGDNIRQIREKYTVKITIPDSNGPERVLILAGDMQTIIEILQENLVRMQCNRDDEFVDLRLLVHQSQVGCVIGRAGHKIKELREHSCLDTLKVYQSLCPDSTDRIIQLVGHTEKVLECLQIVTDLLEGSSPKGTQQNYDARSYNEEKAFEYGGWGHSTMDPNSNATGRRNYSSNYHDGGVMTTGLMGHGNNSNHGQHNSQHTSMQQALVGSLPHASAAAMLAATGQSGGGGGAGPAGDAATAAAAMLTAGLMRGMPNRVPMNFMSPPKTTTQVSVNDKLVGAIMGRSGTRINQVRQQSNADIRISRQEPGADDRIITITGTPEQIQNAQYLLQLCVKRYGDSAN